MVNSGVILLKYWLEVSPASRRAARGARRRRPKTWKLSPMDIKSYTRWDDYSKARDDMFAETDTRGRRGSSRGRTTSGGAAQHHFASAVARSVRIAAAR
jgi:hypothetical protein